MSAPRRGTTESLATGALGLAVLLLGGALAGTSCALITPFHVAPPEDADADADSDGDWDLDADEDSNDGDGDAPVGDGGPPDPGPLTFVVHEAVFLSTREFDIDGNGSLDNMLTDLGQPATDVYVAAMNTLMGGSVIGSRRRISHFPWIDDRASLVSPETTLIVAVGWDTDEPVDRTDDFSGEEPFFAAASSLDGCGEPLYALVGSRLEHGVLTGSGGTVGLSYGQGLPLRNLQAQGTISDGADAFDITLGGSLLIRDLGEQPGAGEVADLTLFESFLLGGPGFGIPALPGLSPDLDMDGDGLETFEISDEGRLLRCVDGDRVVIEGRECWRDPRIGDGKSSSRGSALPRPSGASSIRHSRPIDHREGASCPIHVIWKTRGLFGEGSVCHGWPPCCPWSS